VGKLADYLRNPFSFLTAGSQKEKLMAEYVVREHRRGRPLAEILEDAHIKNNLTEAQIHRLLDRPEIMQAVGADIVAAQRSQV
jgi:hypothetical protein